MTATLMVQDETVSTPGPREGGPRRRRAFTATQKMKHLTAWEQACATGDGGGGAYLRQEAIYSSQITQWRQLRDAGLLAGKKPSPAQPRMMGLSRISTMATRELRLVELRTGYWSGSA